jgi:uncharacterized protein (DUF2126 family)
MHGNASLLVFVLIYCETLSVPTVCVFYEKLESSVSVRKAEGKRTHQWVNGRIFKEIVCEIMGWTHLAQFSIHWFVFANMTMKLQVLQV